MPVKDKGEIEVDNLSIRNILSQNYMAFLSENIGSSKNRRIAFLAGIIIVVILGAEFAVSPGLERGVAQIRADEHEQSLDARDNPSVHLNIAEDGHSNDSYVYFLTLPAVIGGSGADTHRPGTRSVIIKFASDFDFNLRPELTTTAMISPTKAEEFTLVGAKPSGTS